MKEELRHTLLNGEPDILKRVESWHKEKIKRNNQQWAMLLIFTFVIWIGYICTLKTRYEKQPHINCDSIHKVDRLTIEMQLDKLKNAVYFKDIK
jgi:hypothetical protein